MAMWRRRSQSFTSSMMSPSSRKQIDRSQSFPVTKEKMAWESTTQHHDKRNHWHQKLRRSNSQSILDIKECDDNYEHHPIWIAQVATLTAICISVNLQKTKSADEDDDSSELESPNCAKEWKRSIRKVGSQGFKLISVDSESHVETSYADSKCEALHWWHQWVNRNRRDFVVLYEQKQGPKPLAPPVARRKGANITRLYSSVPVNHRNSSSSKSSSGSAKNFRHRNKSSSSVGRRRGRKVSNRGGPAPVERKKLSVIAEDEEEEFGSPSNSSEDSE